MVFEKTIEQVVDSNYVYARALHYLGIDFFEAPHKKLKEVCAERGLDQKHVIKSFYAFDSCPRLSFRELDKYPIELLIAYLKHSHHIFIKEKLPYIVHLIEKWDCDASLKTLLPEFIEDFIKHIYEEEDTVFGYIQKLCKAKKGSHGDLVAVGVFRRFSLQKEFEEHQHGDEFGAIRTLTSALEPQNLHERVILYEINAFDREMIYHAEIENEVFFPKAMKLEAEIFKKIKCLSLLN